MTKPGKTPPRRPPATRREAGPQREDTTPTLNRSHIQGFVAGCMASLVVGIGIMKSGNEAPVALQNPESPPVEIETGPRFDFYTVLPNQELETMQLNPRQCGELRPSFPASQPTAFADHMKTSFSCTASVTTIPSSTAFSISC